MKKVKHALHLATSKDPMRPIFHLIEIKDGVAYCTDTQIAVKIPLNEIFEATDEAIESLNGKFIHAEIWQKLIFGKVCIIQDGVIKYGFGVKPSRFYEVPFDVWDGSLSGKINQVWLTKKDANPIDEIGLNPAYLLNLRKAMNLTTVSLRFSAPNRAIIVKCSAGESNSEGLMMPIMITAY